MYNFNFSRYCTLLSLIFSFFIQSESASIRDEELQGLRQQHALLKKMLEQQQQVQNQRIHKLIFSVDVLVSQLLVICSKIFTLLALSKQDYRLLKQEYCPPRYPLGGV